MRRLIVVVGVNTRQGESVLEALLETPDEWYIRGTARDLTSFQSQEFVGRGVNMVQCDINNREECSQTFVGAYGVFAMTNYWDSIDQNEYEQGVNLVEAARTANVQHFITSGLPDVKSFDETQFDLPLYSTSKTHIQNYLRQFTLKPTFTHITYIYVGFYYQNFITFFVPDSINPEFRYPLLSHARVPLYDVRDTGKIVRECFRYPSKWGNEQILSIVSEQLTMEDICATIREVTDKDVYFVALSYEKALLKLHRETVNNLKWYHDIGIMDECQIEKTKEIWPKMKTFAEWVREIQWLME